MTLALLLRSFYFGIALRYRYALDTLAGGERIPLTNNTFIKSIGIAEGVHTKIVGSMVSTDYLIIECTGKGQITLGRSLLKLLGAKIDVGKGIMTVNSPPGTSHFFPKKISKGKRGRQKAPANIDFDASSLDNTGCKISFCA